MSMSVASDLSLPPPFELVGLREAGDAFAVAAGIAADKGAGTLVWARRFDLAEFAVVLEPEEPLRLARRALYAGANALGDALSAHAPPQCTISFDWPDGVRVDGALVGGVRLAWSPTSEDEPPDWMVFGVMIRTVVMRAGEPGLRPTLGGLDEQGFEELSPGALIEDWTRYFIRELADWNELGFSAVKARWLERAVDQSLSISKEGNIERPDGVLRLSDALERPSWLDPETGAPFI
jgi:biotin-(acetyl-CoA carboxylase) ligase